MGLELLHSQQGNHSESSVKPEHMGVSGMGDNGDRKNFCTLKRQRRKGKKQHKGKYQMSKDIS